MRVDESKVDVALGQENNPSRFINAQKAHPVDIMVRLCHPACLLSLFVVYGRTDGSRPLGMMLMVISQERLRDV